MYEYTMYDKTTGEEFILIGYSLRMELRKCDLNDRYDCGEVVLLRTDYMD